MSNWTIFSNHGHVLVCLARDSEARLRDVASDVGLTERAVQKIVRDLQECDMISVSKHGRRNRYRLNHKKALRHDLEAHCSLGELIELVAHNSNVKTAKSSSKPEVSEPETVKSTPKAPAIVAPVVENAIEKKTYKKVKPDVEEPESNDSPPVKEVQKQKPESTKSETQAPPEREQGSLF